jgi:RNA-directed DNA polymerase
MAMSPCIKKGSKANTVGVPLRDAYAWSRSRMGGWAIAQSLILGTTITKARLVKRVYISLTAMFKMISKNSEMNQLFPMV